jgi:type I restriction enzyme R subunit
MSSEARTRFAAWIPDGDVARYARTLRQSLNRDFVETMGLLRNDDFQDLLVNYPRAQRTFIKAYEQPDIVSSTVVLRDVAGNEYKPDGYLLAFSRFVRENEAQIEAIRVLLDRPREWNATALSELREKLGRSRYRFTIDHLQRAHELHYRKALVDVISMVKHAAEEGEPLLTASERVERAFATVTAGRTFTPGQQLWLDRIRQVMLENLSIDREDFDYQDALAGAGGWGAARRDFGDQALVDLISHLNEAIAA